MSNFNDENESFVGLFGFVGEEGKIENIKIVIWFRISKNIILTHWSLVGRSIFAMFKRNKQPKTCTWRMAALSSFFPANVLH